MGFALFGPVNVFPPYSLALVMGTQIVYPALPAMMRDLALTFLCSENREG